MHEKENWGKQRGGSKGYEWESVEGMVGDVMGQAKEGSWNGNDKKYQ